MEFTDRSRFVVGLVGSGHHGDIMELTDSVPGFWKSGPSRKDYTPRELDVAYGNKAWHLVAYDVESQTCMSHVAIYEGFVDGRGICGHIETVVTHPAFQGRGVGAQLMKAAMDIGWSLSWNRLALVSEDIEDRKAARAMYVRMGFKLYGADRFEFRFGKDQAHFGGLKLPRKEPVPILACLWQDDRVSLGHYPLPWVLPYKEPRAS